MDAVPLSPAPSAVRVPSLHSRTGRLVAIAGLIAVGVALIGFAAGLWLANSSPPASTTTEHNTTSAVGTEPAASGAGDSATTVDSIVRASGGGASGRSETLVTALFGLGTLMLLAGIFFGRIQEVTLPGGAGLKLTPDAQAKVAAKVADEAKSNPQLSDDPATIERLYQITLDHLARRYAGPVLSEAPGGYYVAGAATVGDVPDTEVAEVVSEAAGKLVSDADS
jgi:hypothetical protein